MMNDLQPLFPAEVIAERPLLIAGPCSAESEERLLAVAHALAEQGVRILRAGLWKPRTKPGGFEGVGEEGIAWLQRVKAETGLLVATEVATREHVRAAVEGGIDLLWVGARTTTNPFAIQEIADALQGGDIPVLVKNPTSPDLELWIGAVERLYNAGLRRLGVIHRGFTALEHTPYRNHPMWALPIELRRRLPHLPIICDPSHIAGKRELVAPLAQQALDLGFDGLVIEAHCTPEEAWSDPAQQITPQHLLTLRQGLVLREGTTPSEPLAELRGEIDRLDSELVALLARRMACARRIGAYKRQHNLPILQAQRYEALLSERREQARQAGVSEAFIEQVFKAIHEESVEEQMHLKAER